MALQYGRSLVEYKRFTDALATLTTAVQAYTSLVGEVEPYHRPGV